MIVSVSMFSMRLISLPILLSMAIVACGPAQDDTSADDAPTSTAASAGTITGVTYQRLTYSGSHSVFVANTSVNTFLKIPNLQLTFTKASATSQIELTWNTLAYAFDDGGGLSYCLFQLRVDDVDPRSLAAPGGGGEIAEYDNDLNTTEAQQVSATALWPSLAAGSHTIFFWARSNSVDECFLGSFNTQDAPNFIHSVLVKETP